MSKRKRRIPLAIESLAAGGDGVGRDAEGRVTFVPHSAPGETVLVELVEERKQFARGRVLEILEPGEARQEPPCALFAAHSCGGCQWQHVTLEAQAAAKEAIVDSGLRRAIDRGMERGPLSQPSPPTGWRRRARLSFWAGGPQVLGFFPPRSKKITDVESCAQLEPGLQEALATVREHLLPALRQRGEIELLLGDEGTLVSVQGTVAPHGLEALAKAPGIAGVRNGKRKHGAQRVTLEGGVSASADEFAQASRAGNLALCDLVAKTLGPLEGKRVLELYAGNGNFTRLLGKAEHVVAVERAPAPKESSAQWYEGDVAETCAKLVSEGESFDLVLLDPPRSGAREALDAIIALAPTRIVYVSCDVATLARDIEVLHEAGYRAVHAQPIDLMPQTSHVELVLSLERSAD